MYGEAPRTFFALGSGGAAVCGVTTAWLPDVAVEAIMPASPVATSETMMRVMGVSF
jgi:hypothetical protein